MSPPALAAVTPTIASLAALPLQLGGSALYYALIFFALAVVAALLGQRGIAGMSMQIAKILVVVFLVLAVLSLLL